MKQRNLLQGNIPKHIIRLALPTIGGMFSLIIFNLTDTYFVSALGVDALAAMGFTFPVIMIIGAVSSGISAGAGSRLSRAKGAGDKHLMQRIATDGILLSLLGVIIFSIFGLLSMDYVFTLLGADSVTLPLTKDYMSVWYTFVFVYVMPPVSDNCMRASGDMTRPFIVMMVCAFFNIILDPLLIHGYWIFPALGIKGAAIATVISRGIGMVVSLYFASRHHNLINLKYKNIQELFTSWKSILHLGLPSVTTQLMPQVLRSILTSLTATTGGTAAVAALAIGTRVESFPNIIVYGFSASLIPLIGQNWGAKKYDRAYEVRKFAFIFAICYGVFIFLLSLPLAKYITLVFSQDTKVIEYTSYYLWIILFSSVGLNITNWMSQAFITIGKPKFTFFINVLGTLLLIIPLTYLGNHLYGYIGMLLGVCLGQLILGTISAILSVKYMLPPKENKIFDTK